MYEPGFLLNGDVPGRATILLAHGAGAAMDTPFMTVIAEGLAARGLRVARFEFAYMAERRSGGPKRPPPKVELLQEEFRSAADALACSGPLFIGGKSMNHMRFVHWLTPTVKSLKRTSSQLYIICRDRDDRKLVFSESCSKLVTGPNHLVDLFVRT